MPKQIVVKINLDDIQYALSGMPPEDIFSYKELKKWALDNGFVEESE